MSVRRSLLEISDFKSSNFCLGFNHGTSLGLSFIRAWKFQISNRQIPGLSFNRNVVVCPSPVVGNFRFEISNFPSVCMYVSNNNV